MSDTTDTVRDLALAEATPQQLIRRSTDAAAASRAIVEATAVTIQGRRYVKCEGWQAIAIAHGCCASARDVEAIDGGIRAVGEIRRLDTGTVIATAEGFVGDDESTWSKRPVFARRAMAQTRAISRACRSAFAHVVVAMQAGLETTPAEEMESLPEPPAGAKPPIQPPQRASQHAPGATISDAQRKRLYAIYKSAGHEDEDVRLWLGQVYGIEHSTEIRRDDYDAICARLAETTPLPTDAVEPPPADVPDKWDDT